MSERDSCPNCGAKPLDDRYPAHVDACTGEPPTFYWYWQKGWKMKLNVIFVVGTVIVLSPVAKVYNAVTEAFEND